MFINKHTGIHTISAPHPQNMHSHSHTLTSKHTFTLTHRHIDIYQRTFTHRLINTQIHICSQENTSMSSHAQSHKLTKHNKTKFKNLTVPQTLFLIQALKPGFSIWAAAQHKHRAEIQNGRLHRKEEWRERESEHPNPLWLLGWHSAGPGNTGQDKAEAEEEEEE